MSAFNSNPRLPASLEAFVDLFNQGAYWESHETLEADWRRTRSRFYHGLILYASAWVHHERGNRHGVLAQLAKARPLLHQHAPGYLGIDVEWLLRQGEALERDLPGAEPVILTDFRVLRGNEPELGPGD